METALEIRAGQIAWAPMKYTPWISGLLYPQMKGERAGEHLKELQHQLQLFLGNPYVVTDRDDHEHALYRMFIRLNAAPRSIPILIGEYAYSLRSALDNLAWQLGLLSGRNPSRSSAFPINSSDTSEDRERFLRMTVDSRRTN